MIQSFHERSLLFVYRRRPNSHLPGSVSNTFLLKISLHVIKMVVAYIMEVKPFDAFGK
jgi:hypothetical protein